MHKQLRKISIPENFTLFLYLLICGQLGRGPTSAYSKI